MLFHSVGILSQVIDIQPGAAILDSFNFIPNGLFNFQKCDPNTELIVFTVDDSRFNIECLFNYMTDGITVRRKGEHDFYIKPYWVVLTTENIPSPVPASLSARFDVIDCRENLFLEFLHTL